MSVDQILVQEVKDSSTCISSCSSDFIESDGRVGSNPGFSIAKACGMTKIISKQTEANIIGKRAIAPAMFSLMRASINVVWFS